jgi:PIN domain nuclease of toxin-antitoxin system
MKRLLLDAQAFLFAAGNEDRLSAKASAAIVHRDTALHLSLVSVWEMQIKIDLGKLKLPISLPAAIQKAVTELGLELLSLRLEHVYGLALLPFHHRDPFDRLLISQAIHEDMQVVSNDPAFDRYKVTRLW